MEAVVTTIVLLANLAAPAMQSTTVRFFDNCVYAEDVCPNEHITFWLYTNETQENPQQLNAVNLQADDFKPKRGRTLAIVIHGYTGHRDYSPNTEVRPALLQNLEVFVISVDYGPLAEDPCYIQAVANVPIVAKCIAQLINGLIENEIFNLDEIHVIGFSLGGQVAGVTSNFVHQKLKWITGLDPAKPLFVTSSEKDRLDESDAEFVDVIHTDVFERGMLRASGKIDFYPNLGKYQPGCGYPNATSPGSCNHKRAPEYYAESISTTVGFWGFACAGWLQYFLGLCTNVNDVDHQLMGYFVSKNASGSYFLETNSESPYARGPYRTNPTGENTTFRVNLVTKNLKTKNSKNEDEIEDYISHTHQLPPFFNENF